MLEQDNLLFCPLRRAWVASLPEERVRQTIIQKMTQVLGYPLSTLVIEKNLNQFPHLLATSKSTLPKRRADLVVLAKNIHSDYSLYPLLLIECKSVPLTNKTLRQVIGYNQFVAAPFIAVVNQNQEYMGWYEPEHQDFVFKETFLPYEVLLKLVRA